MDDSFAQYPVTPTVSVADNANVTDVLVVDDAPLFIETEGLDGAVESDTVRVIESLAEADIFPAESLTYIDRLCIISYTTAA